MKGKKEKGMEIKEIKKFFESLGHTVLPIKHKNANGPDLQVIVDGVCYRIECKKARKLSSNSWQVRPVEPARQNDDFIVIHALGMPLIIETMKDHLLRCSADGYRSVTEVYRLLSKRSVSRSE